MTRVLLLLWCWMPAPSQPSTTITLKAAIQEALRNHPNLRRLRADVEASEARIGRARSLTGFQSGLSFRYQRQGPTLDFPTPTGGSVRVVPDEHLMGAITGQKLLFDGGRARGEQRIAGESAQIAREELRNAERTLERDVKRTYFNLLKAARLFTVAEETLQLASEQLRIAQVRFTEGASPRFDVTRSEVEASTARQERTSAIRILEVAKATLSHLLNRSLSESITAAEVQGESIPVEPPSLDGLTRAGLLNRSEMKIAELQASIARRSIRIAGAERYPQVNFQSQYSRQTASAFQPDYNWFAGINVAFNLIDSGRSRFGVREAKASTSSAEAAAEQVRRSIEFEVKQAYLNLLEARQQMETTASTLRSARENLDIARLRYESGVGINLEVMDAQVSLSRARALNVSALYDYLIAVAELEAATGTTMTNDKKAMSND